MQHLIIRLAVAVATFIIGLTAAAIPAAFHFNAPANTRGEQEVLAVEQQYITAHLYRDTATLDRILADDFTLGPAFGRVITKSSRLALLRNADFSFLSIDTDNVKVQVNADEAVVTGHARLSSRYKDEEFSTPVYGFTRVYQKRQGQWQIVSVQISYPVW